MQNNERLEPGNVESNVLHDLKITGDILRAAQNQSDVLDFTVKIFLRLGFDRVRVWLVDRATDEFYGGKSSYISDDTFQKIRGSMKLKRSSPYLTHALSKDTPFINRANLLLKTFLNDHETKETCEFPMFAGKELMGSIGVDNSLTGRKIDLTETASVIIPFVNHVALALYRVVADSELQRVHAELQEKFAAVEKELQAKNTALHQLAHFDELTGLPNRRDFNQRFDEEINRATRTHPLTLAMIDLDFLKAVNDTEGHLIGDRVIAEVGTVIRETRGLTYAARYAGDEFVILLRDTPDPEDRAILERIRQKIKRRTQRDASIGIATYPAPGVTTAIDLVRSADDALYHAKHTGRGRVVSTRDKQLTILSANERRKKIINLEKNGTVVSDYIAQLEVLSDISERLQCVHTESEMYRVVLQAMKRHLGFQRIRIYRADHERGEMICTYATGVKPANLAALNRRIDDPTSLSAMAVATKRVIDTRLPAFRKFLNPLITSLFGTRATVIIPIANKDEALGAIVGDYDPDAITFDETSYRLFLSIGNHVALALQQVYLIDELGLANRGLESRVNAATTQLREYSHSLEQKIEDNKRLRESERRAHFDIISALVVSLESKDSYTRGHSARVARYAHRLGVAIGLSNSELANLRYGALLHDIGKLTIDYDLLNKRTALTDVEVKQLAQHPAIGGKIAGSVQFLKTSATFIRHHHERWDGHGYPDKLKGEAIPLEARIINIADSYDAMVTRRSYGKKMTKKEAMYEFEIGAGKQFDPRLATVFMGLIKKGAL